MKKSTNLWQLMGFAVTSLIGTLLHFLYNWLNGALWIAPFSSVNESTWEHMKLLFWPMYFYSIVQSFFFKDNKEYWCIKLKGILLGLLLIPILFYTYNGVVGISPDWLNIAIFFVSALITYVYEARQFKSSNTNCKNPKYAFLLLCIIALMFIILTFYPPKIGIFIDPLARAY